MELFKIADYLKKTNPKPTERYSLQLLENKTENLIGMFGILPPHTMGPYHYHNRRESVIIAISGKANEIVEGKRTPVQKDDFIFIPTHQKHALENTSNEEFRYIEFQVGRLSEADFNEVEFKER